MTTSDLVGRVRRTWLSITTSVLMVGPDCHSDSYAHISQCMKKKEKQQLNVSKQNKWWNLGWDRKGIDILQLSKGIATEQLMERQLNQAWIFYFLPPDFDWLEVLSFLLDLNKPQKESILFPLFNTLNPFSASFLGYLLWYKKQNGGTSFREQRLTCCGAL